MRWIRSMSCGRGVTSWSKSCPSDSYGSFSRRVWPASAVAGARHFSRGLPGWRNRCWNHGRSREPGDAQAVRHGLYWLTANLSAQRPLALVVDDVHWADIPSLKWLGYLARRLEGMPVVVLVAARRARAIGRGSWRHSWRAPTTASSHPGAQPGGCRPARRGADRVSARQHLRGGLSRCEWRQPVPAPGAAARGSPGGHPHIGPRGPAVAALAPETVARAVLVRLAALPPAAASSRRRWRCWVRTCRSMPRPSWLASLWSRRPRRRMPWPRPTCSAGTEAELIHPLVRTAVEEEMPPSRRRAAHARAARILGALAGTLSAVRCICSWLIPARAATSWPPCVTRPPG